MDKDVIEKIFTENLGNLFKSLKAYSKAHLSCDHKVDINMTVGVTQGNEDKAREFITKLNRIMQEQSATYLEMSLPPKETKMPAVEVPEIGRC